MVKERPATKGPGEGPTGPRGGTSTVSKGGMFRKNLWITHEQNERLRLLAFRTRRPEAALIRGGIDLVLALAEREDEPAAAETKGDYGDEDGAEES